jgi:hypothetical protein
MLALEFARKGRVNSPSYIFLLGFAAVVLASLLLLRFATVLCDIHIEYIAAQVNRHGISRTDVKVNGAGLIDFVR